MRVASVLVCAVVALLWSCTGAESVSAGSDSLGTIDSAISAPPKHDDDDDHGHVRCGDGVCSKKESCKSCAKDCGACPSCGDGQCKGTENCWTCPGDCGQCPIFCGDHVCSGPKENCKTCPQDCGKCTTCAPQCEICDGKDNDCDGKIDEGGVCFLCGNGTCDSNETCSSCPADCGKCCVPSPEVCNGVDDDCDGQIDEGGVCCGDGACDPSESCSSCPADCGACVVCGDGVCNGNETCFSCFDDCGQCECSPGQTGSCFDGPPGSKFSNVDPSSPDYFAESICRQGTRACLATGRWGPCVGEVLPMPEPAVCTPNIDEDCDGNSVGADRDGDGWTVCDGDCCDTPDQCAHPAQVNPGAYEFLNNGVDDDCDPTTSDTVAAASCSVTPQFAAVTGLALAQAMDLCQVTTETAPLPTRKWGLIDASQRVASGGVPSPTELSDMQNFQDAVLENYGAVVAPTSGNTMAGLSSGRMRDLNDFGWAAPIPGTEFHHQSTLPAAYLAQHGGMMPSSVSCEGACPVGTAVWDSSDLRLRIRVPTNVSALRYRYRFFAADYPSFFCTAFNDLHLALLDSSAPGLPADHNIATDAFGNPVSVDNGLITVCQSLGCKTCPSGTGALTGTGMDAVNAGAGTEWITVQQSVVPGETITLDLMILDTSDDIYDSVVLFDDFEWVP